MLGCAASRDNYVETIQGTTIQFDMVWIPQGEFWIGQTEVTWDEYLVYCNFDDEYQDPPDVDVDAVSRPSKPVVPMDRDWGFGRRPAVGMSWNAAKLYCEWLSLNTGSSYRLPSEDEWSIACGPQTPSSLVDHAWFGANSDEMTHQVGEKLPNIHGLYDMLGNLWEYCRNGYNEDDPERAVLRGASWRDGPERLTPDARLGFDDDWVLADPNVPSGVWWVPDGGHLGLRVLRPGDDEGGK